MNVPIDLAPIRRIVFGTVGVLVTAFGLLVLLFPGIASLGPSGAVLARIEAAPADQILLLAGGVAVGALLVGARTAAAPATGDDRVDRRLDRLPTTPPEDLAVGAEQIVAAGLDADVTTAIEDGGDRYRELQETLRTAATAVYADSSGLSRDRARREVVAGSWTGDPVAAALLADDSGPAFGRRRTLRLLVFPVRERDERIRRTIAAIERLEEP